MITMGALWDRNAAEVVGGHAADAADLAGLLAMLGIASAPPRPPRWQPRRDRGRPWPWPLPVREAVGVMCVVGACRAPVAAAGEICAACVTALGPYLRPAGRAMDERALSCEAPGRAA